VIDAAILEQIAGRLGQEHTARRLAREQQHEKEVTRSRLHFLHRDNWFAHPHIIKAALIVSGLYWRGRCNAAKVIVRRNVIAVPDLPRAFHGFTILHLSDLHADGSDPAMQRVLQLVQDLRYDICCLTGDYRAGTTGSYEPALHGMAKLVARLKQPIFAVPGNHDSLAMVHALEKIGITMLLNESHAIHRGEHRIFLAGIDDAHFFRTGDIARATSRIPAGSFSVLLSHTPEVFRQAEQARFKLMLSGHTHGGQICLPGSVPVILDAELPRGFGAGAWRHGTMHGYTSTGAGTSVVPVRFNCPPEITLHVLQCESQAEPALP
jgi:predicted MPP superfamily phosphohydrolase